MNSLKKQATNSVLWSAVERFSVQGIQYIISIILARLLFPSDYGLIAMLSIFLAVIQSIIDGGFGYALIQKKNPSKVDYSTVFYFNLLVSIGLYILLYYSSPLIARFYESPELDLVTKVVGLVLIINSLGIIQQTRLTIELNFKSQAIAAFVSVVISGVVGVILAYKGFGVWALVYHTLFNNLLRVILLWIFAYWRPSLVFSFESFSTMFSFGSKILFSSVLHTIYTNLYTLVIGKKFAETELGYFNRASTLAQFPSSNLTNVIVKAIYPIQCKIQDDDQELKRTFLVYMRMSCYVIFPLMIGLAVLAEPMIRVVLTDKWLPAVPLFQILCIAYMWDPVMKLNHNILNVKGRSDYFFHAEIIKKTLAVIILVATIPFGILVMSLGLILYAFVDMFVIVFYSRKLTGISFRKQIASLSPILILSLSMGGVVYITTHLFASPWISLLIGSVVGIIYYFVASHLFRFHEFSLLLSLVRSKSAL
ncbi:MAG: lipopolysaccharide biosynthesis protein [Bacteroidales bacterium]